VKRSPKSDTLLTGRLILSQSDRDTVRKTVRATMAGSKISLEQIARAVAPLKSLDGSVRARTVTEQKGWVTSAVALWRDTLNPGRPMNAADAASLLNAMWQSGLVDQWEVDQPIESRACLDDFRAVSLMVQQQLMLNAGAFKPDPIPTAAIPPDAIEPLVDLLMQAVREVKKPQRSLPAIREALTRALEREGAGMALASLRRAREEAGTLRSAIAAAHEADQAPFAALLSEYEANLANATEREKAGLLAAYEADRTNVKPPRGALRAMVHDDLGAALVGPWMLDRPGSLEERITAEIARGAKHRQSLSAEPRRRNQNGGGSR